MKINGKSIAITVSLCTLLLVVVLMEISIFISGPARKYEQDIEKQMLVIQRKYKAVKNLKRDVFHYTTYVGEDKNTLVWFNEDGDVITNEKKASLQTDKAKEKAEKEYGAKTVEITLGYGYNNPVYVVKSDIGQILFDYTTLEEVYYLKEGDV